MHTEKTAGFKHRLEEEKKLLEMEMNTVGRKNEEGEWEASPKDEDATATESDEKADKFETYEENADILGALQVRYRAVERALAKIEDNAYGVCEISGEEIEEERLDANPAARTCKAHLDEEKNLPL